MPVNLTFNPKQSRTLDAPVRTISVSTGSVIVHGDGVDASLAADQTWTTGTHGTAALTLYSPDSARVTVTYADEPEAEPATRGDSGGNTGSFESRTDKELRKLAAERNISGRSKLDKAGLIEALRS